jgi:hypothetical protein
MVPPALMMDLRSLLRRRQVAVEDVGSDQPFSADRGKRQLPYVHASQQGQKGAVPVELSGASVQLERGKTLMCGDGASAHGVLPWRIGF